MDGITHVKRDRRRPGLQGLKPNSLYRFLGTTEVMP
jgi:hypothetical protein